MYWRAAIFLKPYTEQQYSRHFLIDILKATTTAIFLWFYMGQNGGGGGGDGGR